MNKHIAIQKCLTIKCAIAQLNIFYKSPITYLKPKQFQSISASLENDVIVLLPTGYGKSIIFHTLPYIVKNGCVIVVSPLTSILIEQESILNRDGTNRCCLIEDQNDMYKVGT